LNWAAKIGVDLSPEKFQPLWPEYGEQALDMYKNLLPDFPLVVLDSVAALLPKPEAQGEVGDRNVGLVARLMSQTMRMTAGILKRTNSLALFTNQLRDGKHVKSNHSKKQSRSSQAEGRIDYLL
jgi:recombination protein RecA